MQKVAWLCCSMRRRQRQTKRDRDRLGDGQTRRETARERDRERSHRFLRTCTFLYLSKQNIFCYSFAFASSRRVLFVDFWQLLEPPTQCNNKNCRTTCCMRQQICQRQKERRGGERKRVTCNSFVWRGLSGQQSNYSSQVGESYRQLRYAYLIWHWVISLQSI